MVIDFCGDERCELTLRKRFILVKRLTREDLLSVYFGKMGGWKLVHLANGIRDLGPEQINL
jgi:hypothetical protein